MSSTQELDFPADYLPSASSSPVFQQDDKAHILPPYELYNTAPAASCASYPQESSSYSYSYDQYAPQVEALPPSYFVPNYNLQANNAQSYSTSPSPAPKKSSRRRSSCFLCNDNNDGHGPFNYVNSCVKELCPSSKSVYRFPSSPCPFSRTHTYSVANYPSQASPPTLMEDGTRCPKQRLYSPAVTTPSPLYIARNPPSSAVPAAPHSVPTKLIAATAAAPMHMVPQTSAKQTLTQPVSVSPVGYGRVLYSPPNGRNVQTIVRAPGLAPTTSQPSPGLALPQVGNPYQQGVPSPMYRKVAMAPVIAGDEYESVKRLLVDFEQLTKIQESEHTVKIYEKDQVISTLRQTVAQLEREIKGQSDEVNIQALMQSREEELRVIFHSRDKQIEFLEKKCEMQRRIIDELKGTINGIVPKSRSDAEQEAQRCKRLATFRENQLRETQAEFEALQTQKQSLESEVLLKDALIARVKPLLREDRELQDIHVRHAVDQLSILEAEVRRLRNSIEELTMEKQDLQHLVIQRDKQVAFLHGIDAKMSDASAVQLGVQAISMVQNSAELKDKLCATETALAACQTLKTEFEQQQQETFAKLTEKRREAANLVETVATRDMHIARLDTSLKQREKEFSNLQEDVHRKLTEEKERSTKLRNEVSIRNSQNEQLREELSSRDNKLLSLQSEIVRRQETIKSLEDRIKTLLSDLAENQHSVAKMVKQSNAKDAYLVELEQQLKQNEVKRQVSYLQEVSKNRKLQMDLRLREDDCSHELFRRDTEIQSLLGDLKDSRRQIEKVRAAFLNSQKAHIHHAPTSALPIEKGNGRDNGKASSSAMTPSLAPSSALLAEPEGVRIGQLPFSLPGQALHVAAVQPKQPAAAVAEQDKLSLSYTEVIGKYPTKKGDAIDEAVAHFLAQPKYEHLRPLFCRLSKASYVLGEKRLRLRLSPKGFLEGQLNQTTDWMPLESMLPTSCNKQNRTPLPSFSEKSTNSTSSSS